ncbi:hypothetical protein Sjap_007334 [Stephania japonica]|uniref:Uncharacterized protein n=1 Tax=Stephania japonica TaxID=461633 RepID=A0AAP0JPN7_9MAGN
MFLLHQWLRILEVELLVVTLVTRRRIWFWPRIRADLLGEIEATDITTIIISIIMIIMIGDRDPAT